MTFAEFKTHCIWTVEAANDIEMCGISMQFDEMGIKVLPCKEQRCGMWVFAAVIIQMAKGVSE